MDFDSWKETLLDMDSLKETLRDLIQNFDPAAFLPDLSSLPGVVELVCRIAVLAGPVILLALGLMYLLVPAREANHSFGYRCFFGMGSVRAWMFTQKLAGVIWSVLGLGMTMVMALICNGYRTLPLMDMVMSAVECLFWQIILVACSYVVVHLTVFVFFNRKGKRRFGK